MTAPLKRLPDQLPGIRWLITEHAIDRYRQRLRRMVPDYEARDVLLAMCLLAHPVKPLRNGLWLWRGPKPLRLRFRVRPGEVNELVTVLEDCDARRLR